MFGAKSDKGKQNKPPCQTYEVVSGKKIEAEAAL